MFSNVKYKSHDILQKVITFYTEKLYFLQKNYTFYRKVILLYKIYYI